MPHPIVEYGLLSQSRFDWLRAPALSGDQEEYVSRARAVSMGNVHLFSVLFLGYQPVKHIADIERRLESYNQAVVTIARDHAKSATWAIAKPIHDLCYSVVEGSPYENPAILLIRETKPEAETTIATIKETLERGGHNGMITKAFCEPLGVENFKDFALNWAKDTVLLRRKSVQNDYSLRGIGIGSSVLGAHPKLVVVDDPISTENSKTVYLREAVWNWYAKTIKGLLSPTTRFVYVGTPKYHGDLQDRIIGTGKFPVIDMPGMNRIPRLESDFEVVEDDKGVRVGVKLTPEGRETIEVPWPCPAGDCDWWKDPDEHFKKYGLHRSPEWLIYNLLLEDYTAFCGEIMLNLVGGEDSRIQPSMLRFYSLVPADVGKLPSEVWGSNEWEFVDQDIAPFLGGQEDAAGIVHGWDHAIGKQRKHDETSFTAGYRIRTGDCFFRTMAGRWDYRDVWEKMVTFYLTDPVGKPNRVVTEGIDFQRIFGEQVMDDGRVPPDAVDIRKSATDKDTSLVDSGLLNLMVNGKAYFDIRDRETINQLLTFTPGNKNLPDDRVDSNRLCYSALRAPLARKAGVIRSKNKQRRQRLFGGAGQTTGQRGRRRYR